MKMTVIIIVVFVVIIIVVVVIVVKNISVALVHKNFMQWLEVEQFIEENGLEKGMAGCIFNLSSWYLQTRSVFQIFPSGQHLT